MVEAPDHNSEGSLAKFLLDFVSVVDLFLGFVEVVGLVVVESVVVDGVGVRVRVWVFVLAVDLSLYELAYAFVLGTQVQVVDYFERSDFVTLVLRQVSTVYPQGIFGAHRES